MEIIRLESRANPSLRLIRSLSQKKFRAQERLFCTEGITLFSEALGAGLVPRCVVLSRSAQPAVQSAAQALMEPLSGSCYSVPESVFLSLCTETAPQGVLAVFPFLEDTENSKKIRDSFTNNTGRYIILERIQDPGNVGSILRSAAAFGYTGALLCGSADLYNPKTVRASMGALFHLELGVFDTTEELLKHVRSRSLPLYGTSPHASDKLSELRLRPPFGILFGNEGAGASEEALAACESVFSIPMHGMESLNAAAAAAVVLYETVRETL